MKLDLLPTRTGGAAENMALDFLLLQRYPHADAIRFRHYGWRAPAFTFGYAQKVAAVRAELSTLAEDSFSTYELCRRPTGGGIVDHRDDWTYALVIPRGHPLEEQRASQSYRAVHEALAAALVAQGVEAITKATVDEGAEATGAGVCFQRAEVHDVVHARSGAKIAGAAQKRNKHGLLFQGSIAQAVAMAEGRVDWDRFEADFPARLGAMLDAIPGAVPWPDFQEDEVEGLSERYASPEWLEYR